MTFLNKLTRNSIILLFLVPLMSYSQEDKVGNWLMYFGTNRVSDNFSIHTEIQIRNYYNNKYY